MAAKFRLRWEGPKVYGAARGAVIRANRRTAEAAVRTAKEYVPVAFGDLRDSLRVGQERIGKRVFWIEWGSYGVNYAFYVEHGTGPHMPPVDALRPWAALVLGDPKLAWPVAIKISREGTDAQPFLQPAMDENYRKHAGNVRLEWLRRS